MKIRSVTKVLSIAVFAVLQGIFTLSLIAPDYTGLWVDEPVKHALYYFPPVASSLFFSIRYLSEQSWKKYFLRILFLPLAVIALAAAVLLPVSVRVDAVRCAQSGICTGGEPFDHMSTIFLILFSFISAFRAFVASIVFGALIRIARRSYSKARKIPEVGSLS